MTNEKVVCYLWLACGIFGWLMYISERFARKLASKRCDQALAQTSRAIEQAVKAQTQYVELAEAIQRKL